MATANVTQSARHQSTLVCLDGVGNAALRWFANRQKEVQNNEDGQNIRVESCFVLVFFACVFLLHNTVKCKFSWEAGTD